MVCVSHKVNSELILMQTLSTYTLGCQARELNRAARRTVCYRSLPSKTSSSFLWLTALSHKDSSKFGSHGLLCGLILSYSHFLFVSLP